MSLEHLKPARLEEEALDLEPWSLPSWGLLNWVGWTESVAIYRVSIW